MSASITREIASKIVADLAELTQRFRAFADTAKSRAPLYSALAAVVADDHELVALLEAAPATQHNPVLLFAAVHDLLLRGLGTELAAFYPNLSAGSPVGDLATAFRSFTLEHCDAVRQLVATNNTQTNEIARCSLFLVPLGRLAADCGPLSLVEVGASAGLNLLLAHYVYEYQPGGTVGGPSSVHLECGTRGDPPLPSEIPVVEAIVGLDIAPIDVRDPDRTRWLQACTWPDQADRFDRLGAALDIARRHPPPLVEGDAVDAVFDTIAGAAHAGHPVVMNSWMLSYLTEERQREYVAELDRYGAAHDLSWVLVESPSQTPGLPIPAAVDDHATALSLVRWRDGRREVERLANCHPHGYWMHWQRG